jgi:hypothetical protein
MHLSIAKFSINKLCHYMSSRLQCTIDRTQQFHVFLLVWLLLQQIDTGVHNVPTLHGRTQQTHP